MRHKCNIHIHCTVDKASGRITKWSGAQAGERQQQGSLEYLNRLMCPAQDPRPASLATTGSRRCRSDQKFAAAHGGFPSALEGSPMSLLPLSLLDGPGTRGQAHDIWIAGVFECLVEVQATVPHRCTAWENCHCRLYASHRGYESEISAKGVAG